MQPRIVPRIPQKSGFEHHHPRTVACLLLGGRAQAATIEMSYEIAASFHASQLTAVTPIDPFVPLPHFTFMRSVRSWVGDVDLAAMRGAARLSIEQFQAYGWDKGLRVNRIIGGSDLSRLTARAAEADLVLIPANVRMDGGWAQIHSEVAEFLVRQGHVSILRVSRRPLDVRKVVLIVSSTGRCSQLAHRYLELGLWPEASVSILPVGDYRPRVAENVREQLGLLHTQGRDAVLLPPIDLDFEVADLEQLLSPFQAAVMGHLSYRAGWFDSVRFDPFEVAASRVPLVLVP
jgi:hypothetical protein